MSFADIVSGTGRGGQGNRQDAQGGAHDLGTAVASFQRNCTNLREQLTDLKRRNPISSHDKSQFDRDLNDLKRVESNLKNDLDGQLRDLEQAPRNIDTAQKRATLAKLLKDFDRVKSALMGITNEAVTLRVNKDINNSSSSSQQYQYSQQNQLQQQQQQQDIVFMPMVSGVDIDELLIEERHRDIVQINKDLVLVNQMMNDMATVVQKQGELITDIADTADEAHEKAQAGLEQVKQAAEYQSSCIMS